MSHGGARKSAGRPKGRLTAKTREVAEQAAETGLTPLEIMIANMRHWHALAETDPEARKLAHDAACDAAPYMHPRLSASEPPRGDVVPLADRLKAYARRDAIEASQGKVVALRTK